jgi:hypothetical protein
MGAKPIPVEQERRIKRLLRETKLGLREIAKKVGCSAGTVWGIKHGRKVKRARPPSAGQVTFREVAPYLCVGCSERAGRDVEVTYDPCVACTARGVQHRPDD